MDNPYNIPYSHEVELKGHDGHVSALALDPKGARLVTGGYDSAIRFWDFNAMDERLKSFRTVEPPTDIISSISYNITGSQFVIVSFPKSHDFFDFSAHH
jgi:WD40 repeat protein